MFPRKPKPRSLGKYGVDVQIGYINDPVLLIYVEEMMVARPR